MKICTKCKAEQPESEFYRSSSASDGLQHNCKSCYRLRGAKRREALAEARAEARQRHGIPATNGSPYAVRKARTTGKLSPGIKAALFNKQRGRCPCCNKPLGKKYHIDHIMPIALGGPNTDDNVQLLRASCNINKGASHPDDYRERLRRRREFRKGLGIRRSIP